MVSREGPPVEFTNSSNAMVGVVYKPSMHTTVAGDVTPWKGPHTTWAEYLMHSLMVPTVPIRALPTHRCPPCGIGVTVKGFGNSSGVVYAWVERQYSKTRFIK